jgi:DNA-binding SARP family transcriptional activator
VTAPAISLQALGAFRVFRDGVPLGPREWQSKKARDLLKLLVARRGRPVLRECLLEALWPGQDPRRTRPRLSVALSTVRAVLDPGRRLGAEHYVSATRETVALETSRLDVDLEAFVASAEAALDLARRADAEQALRVAEAAYTGDFLEDDLYEDWAAAPREEARALYVAVARELVELAVARADHGSAVRYALRILARDAYDERAHLQLVAARRATGSHGESARAYRRYSQRMREIGVRPAEAFSGRRPSDARPVSCDEVPLRAAVSL